MRNTNMCLKKSFANYRASKKNAGMTHLAGETIKGQEVYLGLPCGALGSQMPSWSVLV